MKRLTVTGAVLICLVRAAAGAGQAAEFSGAWTATKETPPGLALAPTPVFGARFWIDRQSQAVVLTRPQRDSATVETHALDGKETVVRVPGATCIGDTVVTTTLTLSGTEMVHTMVSLLPPGASSATVGGTKTTLRLTAPDTIVVEGLMRTSAQAEPTRVATVYKKSTDARPAVTAPPVKVAPAKLAQMNWLSGTWIGTTGTSTSEERWSPAVGGAMHAVSRTLRGGTSLNAFEFLCIAERAGGLVYTALPNARTPATDFFLTAIDATSATFENPAHDFPKKIRYALREDGTLEAVVSGEAGQRGFTLTFKKQN